MLNNDRRMLEKGKTENEEECVLEMTGRFWKLVAGS